MTTHATGTREQWRAAYERQLEAEKDLTRRATALARERQALPWVPVEKQYRFDTTAGRRTLGELFDGRSQLIVRHFMHGPNTPDGCPGCTFETDNLIGAVPHLARRDVTFVLASRSPLPLLTAYKQRMGWDVEWVSSGDSDFDADFFGYMHVPTPHRDYGAGSGSMLDVMELMALSCFALEDGVVHHTYSTYDRGTEALNATWQLLDRAPRGRGEDFSDWPRKRDEYSV
ncbi:Predicted dithiol-disulfide oxidoreductase, DUF899 family [Pseudonocardia ammonioxydans]|uniref:Predicted dithiol-disulfide oxidoreductase, DUF899 family n=1 Tax=Pseudonocardia ammonioxydans TaxID=260086 RepID=A0A1I5BBQ3_PSUAM|nr:DUF899 domain-containing protein [Pseudonocardia ammonioxydans]SFN71969.1 Predicted dithiol-disulfide oxidoreductase, DUF899 family [Pseudonocardia ammonioxydans]